MKTWLLGFVLLITGCSAQTQNFNYGYPRVPEQIFVSGQLWTFRQVGQVDLDPDHKYDGKMTIADTTCTTRTIRLTPISSMALFKETIIHEILHAGACEHHKDATYYNSEGNKSGDHQGLDNAAMVIYEVMAENPDLRAYIFGTQ